MDGNRRIRERLRGLYKLYGVPDLVDEYVSRGGHDDRPDLRVAAFRFFNRHLKKDQSPVEVPEFKPFPGRVLRVFPTDEDIPSGVLNGKIDETFVARAEVKLPEKGEFAAWKTKLLQQVRERSFRAFPKEIPPAKIEREEGSITLTTEDGIEVEMREVRRPGERNKAAHLIILNPGEKTDAMPDWFTTASDEEGVYLLAPRGVGPTTWTKKSPPNFVERAHALLGHTVDEGRVRDIASVIRRLSRGVQWTVSGRGPAGILGAYAALIVPDAKLKVTVVDPPVSHRDGPIFLGVLRVLDVPEALGLLAPTPLTLVNARDSAFGRTVQIYDSAGAAANLHRK
jgi:hypothetical protein